MMLLFSTNWKYFGSISLASTCMEKIILDYLFFLKKPKKKKNTENGICDCIELGLFECP